MKIKETVRKVTLRGVADIMFDRYAGDNKTELPPARKFYFARDGKTLIIPALNIMSFLCAQNTPSAAKRFLDSRKYKMVAQAILAYTRIEPFEIPMLRDGKPIQFGEFNSDEVDPVSGAYILRHVARLKDGVPNPKVRPVVPLPWGISFTIHTLDNQEFTEDLVQNLFIKGGMALGLGTFRGVFGKFVVDEWK